MPKVILHALSGTKKALDACALVEALFLSGRRVVVWIGDAGRAGTFDQYLWTFSQSSFVPHQLWNGSGPATDPVVIAAGVLGNPNGADQLVTLDRLHPDADAGSFSEVHDLVTQAPEDAGRREAWLEAGFEVEEVRGVPRR